MGEAADRPPAINSTEKSSAGMRVAKARALAMAAVEERGVRGALGGAALLLLLLPLLMIKVLKLMGQRVALLLAAPLVPVSDTFATRLTPLLGVGERRSEVSTPTMRTLQPIAAVLRVKV